MPTLNNNTIGKGILRVLADDREKIERLLLALHEAGNTEVHMGRLVTGDYLLDNLSVERKTFSDLCVFCTKISAPLSLQEKL